MKLLFDQNISFRILSRLSFLFSGATQVRKEGLENATDAEIWTFAKKEGYTTIVSFDADYLDIANLKGHPPKIIWLRFGNTTTKGIADILEQKIEVIQQFVLSAEYKDIACLELR